MNAASLLLIVIASIGKVDSNDIGALTKELSGKACAANDGQCVAEIVQQAKESHKLRHKKGKKLCAARTIHL
jgi:hypothetical protein